MCFVLYRVPILPSLFQIHSLFFLYFFQVDVRASRSDSACLSNKEIVIRSLSATVQHRLLPMFRPCIGPMRLEECKPILVAAHPNSPAESSCVVTILADLGSCVSHAIFQWLKTFWTTTAWLGRVF